MVQILGGDYPLTIVMPFFLIIIGVVFFLTVYIRDNIRKLKLRIKHKHKEEKKQPIDFNKEFSHLKKQIPSLNSLDSLDKISLLIKKYIAEKLNINNEFSFEELPRNKLDWPVIEFTKRLSDLKYSGREVTRDELNHLLLFLSKILKVKHLDEKKIEKLSIIPRLIKLPKIKFKLPKFRLFKLKKEIKPAHEIKPLDIGLPKHITINLTGLFKGTHTIFKRTHKKLEEHEILEKQQKIIALVNLIRQNITDTKKAFKYCNKALEIDKTLQKHIYSSKLKALHDDIIKSRERVIQQKELEVQKQVRLKEEKKLNKIRGKILKRIKFAQKNIEDYSKALLLYKRSFELSKSLPNQSEFKLELKNLYQDIIFTKQKQIKLIQQEEERIIRQKQLEKQKQIKLEQEKEAREREIEIDEQKQIREKQIERGQRIRQKELERQNRIKLRELERQRRIKLDQEEKERKLQLIKKVKEEELKLRQERELERQKELRAEQLEEERRIRERRIEKERAIRQKELERQNRIKLKQEERQNRIKLRELERQRRIKLDQEEKERKLQLIKKVKEESLKLNQERGRQSKLRELERQREIRLRKEEKLKKLKLEHEARLREIKLKQELKERIIRKAREEKEEKIKLKEQERERILNLKKLRREKQIKLEQEEGERDEREKQRQIKLREQDKLKELKDRVLKLISFAEQNITSTNKSLRYYNKASRLNRILPQQEFSSRLRDLHKSMLTTQEKKIQLEQEAKLKAIKEAETEKERKIRLEKELRERDELEKQRGIKLRELERQKQLNLEKEAGERDEREKKRRIKLKEEIKLKKLENKVLNFVKYAEQNITSTNKSLRYYNKASRLNRILPKQEFSSRLRDLHESILDIHEKRIKLERETKLKFIKEAETEKERKIRLEKELRERDELEKQREIKLRELEKQKQIKLDQEAGLKKLENKVLNFVKYAEQNISSTNKALKYYNKASRLNRILPKQEFSSRLRDLHESILDIHEKRIKLERETKLKAISKEREEKERKIRLEKELRERDELEKQRGIKLRELERQKQIKLDQEAGLKKLENKIFILIEYVEQNIVKPNKALKYYKKALNLVKSPVLQHKFKERLEHIHKKITEYKQIRQIEIPKPEKHVIIHRKHKSIFEKIRINQHTSKVLRLIKKAERTKNPLTSKKIYNKALMLYYKLPIEKEEEMILRLNRLYDKVQNKHERDLLDIKSIIKQPMKEALKHHRVPKYIEIKEFPKIEKPVELSKEIPKTDIVTEKVQIIEKPKEIKIKPPEVKVIDEKKLEIKPPKLPEKKISDRMKKLLEEKELIYNKLEEVEGRELDRFKQAKKMSIHENFGYHDFISSIKPKSELDEEHKLKKIFEAKTQA